MDPIERLRRLIALATNPGTPSEEARTSAMLVAKMIVEKRIVLSLPGGRVAPPDVRVHVPDPDPFNGHGVPAEVFEEILFGRWRSPAPPPGEEVPQKKIRAKYASRCGRCGGVIVVGESIFWTQGRTPHCEPCGPFVT